MLCLLLLLSHGARAGHWDIAYTYEGQSSGVCLYPNGFPYSCSAPWFGSPAGGYGEFGFYTGPGGQLNPIEFPASVSGTITATGTWVRDGPGDEPPSTVRLEETASAHWSGDHFFPYLLYGFPFPPDDWSMSGSASNGIGSPYEQTGRASGGSSGRRFATVSTAGGQFTRSCTLSVTGTGNRGSGSGWGGVVYAK